jgi:hypothetical protein
MSDRMELSIVSLRSFVRSMHFPHRKIVDSISEMQLPRLFVEALRSKLEEDALFVASDKRLRR